MIGVERCVTSARSALLAAAVVLTTACAARSSAPSRADLQALADLQARAGELVRQGCYDCLLEARGLYERAAASSRRAMLPRLFEVELLLALREKELAIDASGSMARAAALAAEPGAPDDAARHLAIADAIPPDNAGTPRAGRRRPPIPAGRGQREQYLDEALATIRGSALSAPAREYLATALQCGIGRMVQGQRIGGRGSGTAAPQAVDPGADAVAPLLVYRQAICSDPVDVASLEEVRAAVPRFAEAALFLGRGAMARLMGTDGTRVRVLLEEAYARFPSSPSVTFHLATVHQATDDCRRGEAFFGETLALAERHEDARLGRAICRTYLSDHEGAIADATVLIDAGASDRAEGYYWRAWNRWQLKQLDTARADIDSGRLLLYSARVLTLAGMIEHDQGDFDRAKEDLLQARELDPRECQAHWYLGLVGFATERWPESALGFADAAGCYELAAAETERQREAMAARTDISEEFRTRQLAGFDAAIREDRTQASAADLNAAINYARAGDVPNATVYMKRAAVDPDRRLAVEDLRQVLGVPRW